MDTRARKNWRHSNTTKKRRSAQIYAFSINLRGSLIRKKAPLLRGFNPTLLWVKRGNAHFLFYRLEAKDLGGCFLINQSGATA
jgi:hypothetical protein